MNFNGPDQVVTSTEKVKLLGFLRRTHGKAETPAEDVAAPKKITLKRRKVRKSPWSGQRGATKTTVNVEVRQKRTYVKRSVVEDEAHAQVDPQREDAICASSKNRSQAQSERAAAPAPSRRQARRR